MYLYKIDTMICLLNIDCILNMIQELGTIRYLTNGGDPQQIYWQITIFITTTR